MSNCVRLIVAHAPGGYRPCSDPATTHRDVNGALAIDADARNALPLTYRADLCHQHAKEWDENGAL